MRVGNVISKTRNGATADNRGCKKFGWCGSLLRYARSIHDDGRVSRFGRVIRNAKVAGRYSGPLVEYLKEDASSRPARHTTQEIICAEHAGIAPTATVGAVPKTHASAADHRIYSLTEASHEDFGLLSR